MITAKNSEPKSWPMVKIRGTSEKLRAERNQANPVAAISMPTRLSGRRAQAYRPTQTNPHPTTTVPTPHAPAPSSSSLVRVRASTASPITNPAAANAQRARRRLVIGGSQQRLQRGAGELRLRDEAANAADRAKVVKVPARGQHHHGTEPVGGGDPGGHLRPVDVRELHVEKDDVGHELPDRKEGALSVLGLADHVESLRFEQHAGARAEARVIVDDEHRGRHAGSIVVSLGRFANTD